MNAYRHLGIEPFPTLKARITQCLCGRSKGILSEFGRLSDLLIAQNQHQPSIPLAFRRFSLPIWTWTCMEIRTVGERCSFAFHPPSPSALETGTRPATWLGIARNSSPRWRVETMPHSPARRRDHVRLTPGPDQRRHSSNMSRDVFWGDRE